MNQVKLRNINVNKFKYGLVWKIEFLLLRIWKVCVFVSMNQIMIILEIMNRVMHHKVTKIIFSLLWLESFSLWIESWSSKTSIFHCHDSSHGAQNSESCSFWPNDSIHVSSMDPWLESCVRKTRKLNCLSIWMYSLIFLPLIGLILDHAYSHDLIFSHILTHISTHYIYNLTHIF
jgi:hypothetical protein